MQDFTDLRRMSWVWGKIKALCGNLLPLVMLYVVFLPIYTLWLFFGVYFGRKNIECHA